MSAVPPQPLTLVFDFDGTIADSFATTLAVANRLAPRYGYRPVTNDEAEYLRSRTYREAAEHIGLSWHKIPLVARAVRRDMRASLNEMKIFEGLLPVLNTLQAQHTLGILSSNSRENIQGFNQAHSLHHFQFISTASNLWGKARSIRTLLKQRALKPEQVVYVGDEVRDIEACRDASIRVVAVGWGYTHPRRLSAAKPDVLVSHPAELPAAIAAM